jgi:hypothetical protein
VGNIHQVSGLEVQTLSQPMVTFTVARSTCTPRARLYLVRAPSLAVLNVASVRSLHAHTAPPSHTESIESAQVLSSMVPCWHSGSIQRLPLSLMTVIFPRAFPQSRAAADQYASLLSTPTRFTAQS